jgi:hypothetical protein
MNKPLKSRLAKLEVANASRRVRYAVARRPLTAEEMASGTYVDDDDDRRPMTPEEWAAQYCVETIETDHLPRSTNGNGDGSVH